MFLLHLIFVRHPLLLRLDLHHLILHHMMYRLRAPQARLCRRQDVLPVRVHDFLLPRQHLQGVLGALLDEEPGAQLHEDFVFRARTASL